MILALLAALQISGGDSIPSITLEEALRLSVRLDPGYVTAIGRVDNAAWSRRAAISRFILPSLTAQTTATRFSTEIFNIGTGDLSEQIVEGRLEFSYNLFQGGAKFYDAKRTGAEVESARAGELRARFDATFQTESDYYVVLAEQELVQVAQERVRRAEEQFAVARARVSSGAAVQTDSLQLLLELTRARVDLLRQRSLLKVARIQLGRRIGVAGLVDAAPLSAFPDPELPIAEEGAVREALANGPDYKVALAEENVASAAFKAERGAYLPEVSLFAQLTGFDESFFPSATTRSLWGVNVRLPIWDGGQREIAITRARTNRDATRAVLKDMELQVRRDVVRAFEAYNTARASTALAEHGLVVAQENLRVQSIRYRGGATTILDLLAAQVSLSEAEAGLVQARLATRLALAGLEALIGRRIFSDGRSEE